MEENDFDNPSKTPISFEGVVIEDQLSTDQIIEIIKEPPNDNQLLATYLYMDRHNTNIIIDDEIMNTIIHHAQLFMDPRIALAALSIFANYVAAHPELQEKFIQTNEFANVIAFILNDPSEFCLKYFDILIKLGDTILKSLHEGGILKTLLQYVEGNNFLVYLQKVKIIAEAGRTYDEYTILIQSILDNLYNNNDFIISNLVFQINIIIMCYHQSYNTVLERIMPVLFNKFDPANEKGTKYYMKLLLCVSRLETCREYVSRHYKSIYERIKVNIDNSSPKAQIFAIQALYILLNRYPYLRDMCLNDGMAEFIIDQIESPVIMKILIPSLKTLSVILTADDYESLFLLVCQQNVVEKVIHCIETYKATRLCGILKSLSSFMEIAAMNGLRDELLDSIEDPNEMHDILTEVMDNLNEERSNFHEQTSLLNDEQLSNLKDEQIENIEAIERCNEYIGNILMVFDDEPLDL